MTACDPPVNERDRGRILRSLAAVERRHAVEYLQRATESQAQSETTPPAEDQDSPTVTVPLADLARALTTAGVTPSRSEATYRALLHHKHLPMLTSATGVDYDPETHKVEYSPDAQLEDVLACIGRPGSDVEFEPNV